MNKEIKVLGIANLGLALGIIIFLAFYIANLSEKKEQVYIDNIKLFNGFNMSKDLSEMHSKSLQQQGKKVDSLYQQFQFHVEAKNESAIKNTQQLLQAADQELKKLQQYASTEVSKQVWDRLNTYIKDFSVANEYAIVFGTQGNGNVMYAKESIDITKEVLEYANSKYEGN